MRTLRNKSPWVLSLVLAGVLGLVMACNPPAPKPAPKPPAPAPAPSNQLSPITTAGLAETTVVSASPALKLTVNAKQDEKNVSIIHLTSRPEVADPAKALPNALVTVDVLYEEHFFRLVDGSPSLRVSANAAQGSELKSDIIVNTFGDLEISIKASLISGAATETTTATVIVKSREGGKMELAAQ
jgi:hypothetical protein